MPHRNDVCMFSLSLTPYEIVASQFGVLRVQASKEGLTWLTSTYGSKSRINWSGSLIILARLCTCRIRYQWLCLSNRCSIHSRASAHEDEIGRHY